MIVQIEGGLGNAIQMVPAIRVLMEQGSVTLCIRTEDLNVRDLFARWVRRNPARLALASSGADFFFPYFRSIRGHSWEEVFEQGEWLTYVRSVTSAPLKREWISCWAPFLPEDNVVEVPGGSVIIHNEPKQDWLVKVYPRMTELAVQFAQQGRKVYWVGLRSDSEVVGEDLRGCLTLPQLAALLSRVSLLVSIDSGVAHLGASVGCPTVILFGPTSVRKNRPWGGPRLIIEPLGCKDCQSKRTLRRDRCARWGDFPPRCMLYDPDQLFKVISAWVSNPVSAEVALNTAI